ncbi:hypothetical protein ACIA8O_25720 [Kitasatospora sp. NPDC051853]|uniref:hypothetical protein n=1 Tax=Kitasatospora sp. NPDC051853 TaxID=3364058 RepID=UPI0037B7B9DE
MAGYTAVLQVERRARRRAGWQLAGWAALWSAALVTFAVLTEGGPGGAFGGPGFDYGLLLVALLPVPTAVGVLADLYRPVVLTVGPHGLGVKLPLRRAGVVTWDRMRRLDVITFRTGHGEQQVLVVEVAAALPFSWRNTRQRRCFARLVDLTGGDPSADGLAFESAATPYPAVELFHALRAQAPASTPTADLTASPLYDRRRSSWFRPGC